MDFKCYQLLTKIILVTKFTHRNESAKIFSDQGERYSKIKHIKNVHDIFPGDSCTHVIVAWYVCCKSSIL